MCLRRYAAICARQRRTRRLRQCRQLKSPARLVQLPPVFSFLYRSTAWFLRKVLAAVVIVSLALVTYAVYLFLHDTTDLDATRAQRIAILSHRQETLLAERTEVEGRIESLRVKLSIEQERADRAGRVIDTLESLRSRWERWFGNAAQQRNNDEQIARMKNVQSDARQVVLQLQRSITQAAWEREGLEVAIEPVERELTALQKVHSPALHYLNTAWYRARWIIRNKNLADSTLDKLTTIFEKQFLGWANSARFTHLAEITTADLEDFREYMDGRTAREKKETRTSDRILLLLLAPRLDEI